MQKCPHCAEMIQDEATVCRYCGRDVMSYTEAIGAGTRACAPWIIAFLFAVMIAGAIFSVIK